MLMQRMTFRELQSRVEKACVGIQAQLSQMASLLTHRGAVILLNIGWCCLIAEWEQKGIREEEDAGSKLRHQV